MLFRNIVSDLSLKPSAQGRLNDYWKQLHKERTLRQLALLMGLILLGIQIAIMIAPPDPIPLASDPSAIPQISDQSIESTVAALPSATDWQSLTVVGAVLLLATFFYIRNRQLLIEASILRGNQKDIKR